MWPGRARSTVVDLAGASLQRPAGRESARRSIGLGLGVLALLLVCASIASAATVQTIVKPPNGMPLITVSSSTLTCSDYGTNAVVSSGSFGSRVNCTSLCAQNPTGYEGTYYEYAQTTGTLTCAGAPIPSVPSTTPSSLVDFCVAGTSTTCYQPDDYCDCSPPPAPTLTPLPGWYRKNQSVPVSLAYDESGGGRANAYVVSEYPSTIPIYNPFGGGFGGFGGSPTLTEQPGSWYQSAGMCNNVKQSATQNLNLCQATATILIGENWTSQFGLFGFTGYTAVCMNEGPAACTVRSQALNYWDLLGPTLIQSVNTDFTAPHTTFDGWSRPPDYVQPGTGTAWYKDQVGYSLTCADNLGAAQSAGCFNISHLAEPSTTACPASASMSSYDLYGHSTTSAYTSPPSGISCSSQLCALKLCYFSDDAALSRPGNVETQHASGNVTIDGLAPNTTNRTRGGIWRAANFTVTLACNDGAGSGCSAIHLHSNSGTNTVPCSGPYTQPSLSGSNTITTPAACAPGQACKFSICYYSQDHVGNIEPTRSTLFGVDRQKPVIGGFQASGLVVSNGENWSGPQTVSFTVPLSDGTGSGIGSCEYRVTNGASVGAWRSASCRTGSAVFGGEVDSSSASFQVKVGASGQCSVQGSHACTVEVRANDTVGNSQTASFSFGVDYTAPSCRVSSVSIPRTLPLVYAHFSAPTQTLAYGTPPAQQSYTVFVLSNDSNGAVNSSGIAKIVFPFLTSPGGSHIEAAPAYPKSTVSNWSYTFNASNTETGAQTFTVTDAVGNSATCSITLSHDTTGPRVWDGDVNYSHMVAENASVAIAHLDLWAHLNATDPSGIQAVMIKEQNTTRATGTSIGGSPECKPFPPIDPVRDRTIAFVRNGFFGPVSASLSSIGPTNWSRLVANVTAEAKAGSCLRFYGVVYDGAGNVNTSQPRAKEVAIDAFNGTSPDAACAFFSTFDNCNDRAGYLNGLPVQAYETTACPGACVYGKVFVTTSRSGTKPLQGAPVSIQGITGKPWYSTVSASDGYYQLLNISDRVGSSLMRAYDFQARPPLLYRAFYSAQVVPRTLNESTSHPYPPIYQVGFDIGLQRSTCTSACTSSTDPGVGTCHVGCAGFNGCLNASGGPGFDASSPAYAALQACDGLPVNSQTSANGKSYACCTQPLAGPQLPPIHDAVSVPNATHIVRNERLVYLNGRLVKMITILFQQKT